MINWNYILPIFAFSELFLNILLPVNSNYILGNYLFPVCFLALFYLYRKERRFQISLLLITLFCAVQILSNYLNKGINFSEFLWSIQWFKIFTLFWCGLYSFKNWHGLSCRILEFCFLTLAVINALQLMEIPLIIELYAPSVSYLDLINFSVLDTRIFGSFSNPNTNAAALLLFACFFLFYKIKNRWSYVAISGMLIFMTQSRTALLAFLVILLIYLLKNNRLHWKKTALYGSLSACIFATILLVFKFDYILMLFDGRIFESNSFLFRIASIKESIIANTDCFILGQGKVKNIPELIGYSIDNQYAYIYLEYGLVGLMVFSAIIISILKHTITNRYYGAMLMLFVLLFIGVSNLSFSNSNLISLYAILLGAGVVGLSTSPTNVKST